MPPLFVQPAGESALSDPQAFVLVAIRWAGRPAVIRMGDARSPSAE